jgi:DNA-binding CsgD family transcriptional regulator
MTPDPFDTASPDKWEPAPLRAEIERSIQVSPTLLISGRIGSGRTRAGELAQHLLREQGDTAMIHRLESPNPIPTGRRLILLARSGVRAVDLSDQGPMTHVSVHPWSRSAVRRALRGRASENLADQLHRVTAGHLGFLRCWTAAGMPEDLTSPEIWQPFVDRAVDQLPAGALALAEELCSGFRALGDPVAPALRVTGTDPSAGSCLDELDRSGLLGPDGDLVPAAIGALRRRLPAYRRHQLRNHFLDTLTDPSRHGDLMLELAAAAPDSRLGPHLLRLGEQATHTHPAAARTYLEAARSHEAAGPRLHAALAEAALQTGDTHTAIREAEQALDSEPGEVHRRALLVAQQVWLVKGDPEGAAQLNRRYASNTTILEATTSFLIHLRIGDREQASRTHDIVTELPAIRVDDTACKLLVEALHGLAVANQAPEPDLLDRLCEIATEVSHDYRRDLGWTTITASMALAGGRAGAAQSMLAAIPDNARTAEEHLLLAWAELHRGDIARATELLAEQPSTPPTPRTDFLARGLALAIAQHTNDRDALAKEWPEAVTAAGRCRPDLFGLVPYPELLVAAARLRESDSIKPARGAVQELLDRLKFPPLWSNLIDWGRIQAAILTDAPDQVREPAQRLSRAATTSPQAKVLAQAGRVWIEVLARRFEPGDVFDAVQQLVEIGNATDGARLASHAAARCDDAFHRRELLDLARQTNRGPRRNGPAGQGAVDDARLQLTEREVDVALLVVQHLNYREVGERLFLSPRTVENHIARIKRRSGVTHRRELLDLLSETLRDLGRLD